jgi:hypothetical protein
LASDFSSGSFNNCIDGFVSLAKKRRMQKIGETTCLFPLSFHI